MFGMAGDGGPMDYLRGRVNNWQAHPFQNIFSTIAGMAGGPMAGFGAQQAFNRWNDNRFNNAATQTYDRGADQGNQAAQQSFDKPLNGPLGLDTHNDVSGAGGSMNAGGPIGSPYSGGYNQQTWDFGYGGQLSGNAPQQPSSFVNDILNSISTGPGQPGTQTGGLFDNTERGPEARRDGSAGGFGGHPANYGVSPMQVNGANVIFGQDPNGMVMANGRRNMY